MKPYRESLPNVLHWFEILDDPEIVELSPLDNAIEKMEETNKGYSVSDCNHVPNTNSKNYVKYTDMHMYSYPSKEKVHTLTCLKNMLHVY